MKGGGWEVGGDMWMARDERCRSWRVRNGSRDLEVKGRQ